MTNEEIATNKESEAQRERERRQRIRELSNVSKEKDTDDTTMDEEAKEENPLQGDSDAHFNQTLNTGVSPNPQIFFLW